MCNLQITLKNESNHTILFIFSLYNIGVIQINIRRFDFQTDWIYFHQFLIHRNITSFSFVDDAREDVARLRQVLEGNPSFGGAVLKEIFYNPPQLTQATPRAVGVKQLTFEQHGETQRESWTGHFVDLISVLMFYYLLQITSFYRYQKWKQYCTKEISKYDRPY